MCTRFRRVFEFPILDTSAVNWPGQPDQIMFPCVVEMDRYLNSPIDRFYMYYAPHHGTGIGLATSPHPEGPWTPYHGNPVLSLDRTPGFQGHISSPEIAWCEERRLFHLYFHGSTVEPEGCQAEGLAFSEDGVNFEPYEGNPIFHVGGSGWDAQASDYLRVFRRGDWWYGVYMGIALPVPSPPANAQGMARSRDGIRWEKHPSNPLLKIGAEHREFDRIRHSGLHVDGETLWVYYSSYADPECGTERIRAATVDLSRPWEDWRMTRRGDVLLPELEWEGDNLRDPFPFEFEGRLYLYYVGGVEKGIGLAIAE